MEVTQGKPGHVDQAHDATQDVAHADPPYMGVFWILLILTVIEVGAGYVSHLTGGRIHIPELILVPLLLALAIAKATLVGMFYMHLRYDTRILSYIFLGAFGLAIAFGVAIIPKDYWGF